MLTIRMQRGGRSGHPQYRVVVQDSRFSPTSGRIVAQVGTYNPHTKATSIDKEAIEKYLSNGAQPSDRVAKMLANEGVKLPSWVKVAGNDKTKATRNVGKLRRNTPEAPVEEVAEVVEETAETTPEATVVEETTEATEA